MARKIVWTKAAWSDLEGIADYIAKDSVYYSAAFVREVRDALRTLEKLAQRGRIVPEFSDRNIRELLIENYRLIYKAEKTAISILGLIHGARDLKTLWKRKRTIR